MPTTKKFIEGQIILSPEDAFASIHGMAILLAEADVAQLGGFMAGFLSAVTFLSRTCKEVNVLVAGTEGKTRERVTTHLDESMTVAIGIFQDLQALLENSRKNVQRGELDATSGAMLNFIKERMSAGDVVVSTLSPVNLASKAKGNGTVN